MFDAQSSDVERVYVFHGTDSTQVLGPEHLMGRVRGLLTAAGTAAAPEPPLHPDITLRPFTAEAGQDPGGSGGSWARQHSTVSDLSVEIGAQRFWDRVEAGSWATWREQWPDSPDGALFPPSPPGCSAHPAGSWTRSLPRWDRRPPGDGSAAPRRAGEIPPRVPEPGPEGFPLPGGTTGWVCSS